MSKEFDKKINQKISGAEISPSTGLWDKIEEQLPKENNKKKFFLIPIFGAPMFKTAIAASVMFLLGGFSAYYFLNGDANTNLADKEQVEPNNTEQFTEQKDLKTIDNDCFQEEKKNEEIVNQNYFSKNTKSSNNSTALNTVSLSNNSTKANTYTSVTKEKNTNKNNYKSNSYNSSTIINNNSLKASNNNSNLVFGTKASDYAWVYDESTGAYAVQLKSKALQNEIIENNNNFIANTPQLEKDNETETSFMSIIEEKKEEKPEIIEETDEEPVLKAFNSKSDRINYQGFWLGPQIGFEGIFVADEFYPGGSFGVDVGYDFGSSWGIQTGLKYAINSKTIQIEQDGNLVDYSSEFNSFHIPVFARYKFTKITQSYSKPLSLNLVGGLDYAYVDRKKLHQLGLNIGAEYDIFTQADLMFTVGTRGGIYNNLNLDNIDGPENINRYNYMLSAYLSVRFIDWAKKK